MKCPSCGETNDQGMMFCILCGHSLAAPVPSAPTPAFPTPEEQAQPLSGPRVTGTGSVLLICALCNKADPLNGLFCVYCGGRTVAASTQSASSIPVVPASTFNNSRGLSGTQAGAHEPRNLSEEMVRSLPQKAKSSGGTSIVAVILAVIFGGAVAVAGTYQLRAEIEKTALRSFWPKEGLLVFSQAPNGYVTIEDDKKKSLIFGKTSADGSLYVPALSSGSYQLSLSDGGGKTQAKSFSVNVGELSIIGHPNRLELK